MIANSQIVTPDRPSLEELRQRFETLRARMRSDPGYPVLLHCEADDLRDLNALGMEIMREQYEQERRQFETRQGALKQE